MSLSNLYGKELARVFDTMYQGFIDYAEEYEYYATKTKYYKVQNILEIGCGTGNLAKYLLEHFDSYLGLDLSDHMLQLAREKNLNGQFVKADMRSFSVDYTFDMALIPGRSLSYLLAEMDLLNTFQCISNSLSNKGHLMFDCIDAERFVPYVRKNPKVTHHSKVELRKFKRLTHWYIENQKEHLINWSADYFEQEKLKEVHLGKDQVTFKAFTRKEIIELLEKTDYKILSIEDRPSYAFDTFVVHAQKTH